MKRPTSTLSRAPDRQLRRPGLQPKPARAATAATKAPIGLQRALADPGSSAPGEILALQKAYGNRAVQRLLSSNAPIQPQLTVGAAGDRYEQEADRLARQVVGQINRANGAPGGLLMEPGLQRRVAAEGTVGLAGGALDADTARGIEGARGGGQPLPDGLRGKMEGAFGADFSGVRVHADAQSDSLNRAVSARAFTTGQDVFFRQGEYNTASSDGQRLIAHELTHVVQQNGGRVRRQAGLGGTLPGVQREISVEGRTQELEELLDMARQDPDTAELADDARVVAVLRALIAEDRVLPFGSYKEALEFARKAAAQQTTGARTGTPEKPEARKKLSGKKVAGMLGLSLLSVLTGGLAGAVYMGVTTARSARREREAQAARARLEAEKPEETPEIETEAEEEPETPLEEATFKRVSSIRSGDILVERGGPSTTGSVNRFPEMLHRLWMGQTFVAEAGFRRAGIAISSTTYARPRGTGAVKAPIEGEFFVYRCNNRDIARRAANLADNWSVDENERDSVRLKFMQPKIYEALSRAYGFNGSRALSVATYFKQHYQPRTMLSAEFAVACYQAAVLKPEMKRLKDFRPPATTERTPPTSGPVRVRFDPERVRPFLLPARLHRDSAGIEPSWGLEGVF